MDQVNWMGFYSVSVCLFHHKRIHIVPIILGMKQQHSENDK